MEASERHNTLVHFRFNPEHKAQRGEHGLGSNCTGQDGRDVILKVPVGTVVFDEVTGEKVHEFTTPDERITVAKGGRGGRGNQHFATPTHQAPRHCEPGREGEQKHLRLELKLLADVGLVGYPNVGKSTLISVISAARPKIANYEFTTLQPNLGVATIGEAPNEESYVVADIPGLIEGAHLGHGLGTQFLRHIERTRLLVHLIDVSDASARPDPVKDYQVIMNELESFGAGLVEKPMLLVAAKADVANPKKLEKIKKFAERKGIPFAEISAVTGAGVQKLKYQIGKMVREIREGKYIVLEPKREAPKKARRIPKPSRKAKAERTPKKAARKRASAKRTTANAKAQRRRAS
jgi:GTPase